MRWVLSDNRSLNGVLVNGDPVGEEGRALQHGDCVTFGRKMQPPEFEFVFEAPALREVREAAAAEAAATVAAAAEAAAAATSSLEDVFAQQMKMLDTQRKEIEEDREQLARKLNRQASTPKPEAKKDPKALDITDLHSELLCSICQDWLVHAATLECSHTFCWSCIDTWLLQKKFECPVCRQGVSREPVPSRALDTIVQKSVARCVADQQSDHAQRVAQADCALEKRRRLHADLEKSVNEALKKGKAFFHIDGAWTRKERDVFQRGVKDYTGETRETYCRLTGLTVQWVHAADSGKLNQAVHNLGLQQFAGSTEEQIRQRLLMFLRYG